jgi:2-C-methyl-D-erythritol 4-phosphate cytidylyltransferase
VLVHDAARPGLNAGLIEKLITSHRRAPVGGLLALPVVDTVKRCIDGEAGTCPAQRPVAGPDAADVPLQLLREALDGRDRPGGDYR